jgi:hypothetical protein
MTTLSNKKWCKLIERFHLSGLTQKQFAQKHSLNIHTFRGRLYRPHSHDRQTLPSPFVQVQIEDAAQQTTPTLDLRLGSLELRFSTLPDPCWIAELVTELQGPV